MPYKNKSRRLAQSKRWYAANREKQIAYHREYRRNNQEKIRDNRRRCNARKGRSWQYGPGADEHFHLKLQEQNDCCAICHRHLTVKPCLDHNHETKALRGVLCNRCNMLVGVFERTPELVSAVSEYLEKYGGE